MRQNFILLFLFVVSSLFAKPMEALSEYNVFLIHGAGSRWGGLDCDLEGGDDYPQAWEFFSKKGYDESSRLDGRTKDGKTLSPATGMINQRISDMNDYIYQYEYKFEMPEMPQTPQIDIPDVVIPEIKIEIPEFKSPKIDIPQMNSPF